MAVTAIQEWLQAGQRAPGSNVHRQLLVISGSAAVCKRRAEQLLSALPLTFSSCWVGPTQLSSIRQVDIRHTKHLLGQEFDVAVFDAHQPFRPSAFLALAGTIKRGGRLIILTPDLASWHLTPTVLDAHFVSYGYTLPASPYLKRFQTALTHGHDQQNIAHWRHASFHLPVAQARHNAHQAPSPFITQDQADGFAQAQQAMNASGACVVITAPRGRGKSSLLGLLAADRIKQGIDVALTSPVSHNTQAIFDIAQKQCDGVLSGQRSPHLTDTSSGGRLQWFAPDNPGLTAKQQHCLIIDEAASLPLPVLRQLIVASEQLILATTTQGYEGSGQGFTTRFLPLLERTRTVTHCRLTSPIRWFDDDPLEQFCADNLLITDDVSQTAPPVKAEDVNWSKVQFDVLSESHFRQVIHLLVSAHYQTTPDDIMRIVDAPDTFLILGTAESAIVAVCIVTAEGGERLAPVASDISMGARRVRGHLGAQRLSLTSALPQLASLRYWRVNRIAVHPAHQNQGIGSQCLTYLHETASEHNIDALTSSFGATKNLINFWLINGFEQIAAGQKPDKASGERSALVLRALSHRTENCLPGLRQLFLYDTSQRPLPLLAQTNAEDRFCIDVIVNRLRQFAQGTRSFDHLGVAWQYFLLHNNDEKYQKLTDEMGLRDLTHTLRLAGKRETSDVLQQAVADFLN